MLGTIQTVVCGELMDGLASCFKVNYDGDSHPAELIIVPRNRFSSWDHIEFSFSSTECGSAVGRS